MLQIILLENWRKYWFKLYWNRKLIVFLRIWKFILRNSCVNDILLCCTLYRNINLANGRLIFKEPKINSCRRVQYSNPHSGNDPSTWNRKYFRNLVRTHSIWTTRLLETEYYKRDPYSNWSHTKKRKWISLNVFLKYFACLCNNPTESVIPF